MPLLNVSNLLHVIKAEQYVTDYISEVKELSRFCNFEKSEGELTPQLVLEENLRDRFVCGLGESRIQRRLLKPSVLTYQQAITIANAIRELNILLGSQLRYMQ